MRHEYKPSQQKALRRKAYGVCMAYGGLRMELGGVRFGAQSVWRMSDCVLSCHEHERGHVLNIRRTGSGPSCSERSRTQGDNLSERSRFERNPMGSPPRFEPGLAQRIRHHPNHSTKRPSVLFRGRGAWLHATRLFGSTLIIPTPPHNEIRGV